MTKSKKGSKRWGAGIIVAAAVLALGWWTDMGASLRSKKIEPTVGQAVRRGPLRISVVERGNLKAADAVTLKNETDSETTILSLIEEGTRVEPGDVVCELDDSRLVERRVQQEIGVQNAEAAYVKAKQQHEIQVSQNESDIALAERELAFARVDRTKYLEGDWVQQEEAKKEAIVIAEVELKQAKQDLQWSERLNEKGFLEQTLLEADRLKAQKAEISHLQKERELDLLRRYEDPRQRAVLDADVVEKERELERVNLQAKARIVDFDADKRTTKAKFDLESDELAKLLDQIEKSTLRAPVAGMIVYAMEQGGGRYRQSEPIQEGTTVRRRQEIITIPSAQGMVVEASLHESILEKVQPGMPCFVSLEARPDRTFTGRVRFKAMLPDQGSWWANPDLRVYRTEIDLLDADEDVRPGMSCSVEIVVADLEDTLHAPVQAIFLDAGKTVGFVSEDGEIEKRSLEVGMNNGKWVELVAGAEEGEVLLLSQPSGFTLEPVEEEEEVPSLEGFPPMEAMAGREGRNGERGGQPGFGGPAADAGRGGGREGGGERVGREGGGREGRRGGMGNIPGMENVDWQNMSREERQAMMKRLREARGSEGSPGDGGGREGGRSGREGGEHDGRPREGGSPGSAEGAGPSAGDGDGESGTQ